MNHFASAVRLIAAGLLLAFAPGARADSITYVKPVGELWIRGSDGSGDRLVAKGEFTSTSQAGDGTILAIARKRIVRLSRQGRELSGWGTETENMPASPVIGPYDARVSPDGTKVAYWVGVGSSFTDPTGHYWSVGAFTIWRDARTGASLGVTGFHSAPSWVDNDRALLFDDGATASAQVVVAGVGQDHGAVTPWFRDEWANGGIGAYRRNGEGERSADGRRLATVRSANYVGGGILHEPGNAIAIYDAPTLDAPPTLACEIHSLDGAVMASPHWSPAGDAVLWEQPSSGTWVSPVGADCSGIAPRLLIAGGFRASWSALEPGQPDAQQGGAGAGAGSGSGQAGAPGSGGPRLSVTAPSSLKATALRGGLRLTVHLPVEGKAEVSVLDGRTRIAHATTKRLAAGDHPVRITVAKRYRARLGRRGHRTLTVRVRSAGAAATSTIGVRR